MIQRIHSSMFAVPFALAFAGCGGGTSGPPGTLSAAVLDAIQRNCQKEFNCQSSYIAAMHNNESFPDHVGGSTVDACVNSIKTLVLTFNGQDYLTKLDASVAAGRIKYNANDYDTCVTAFEALTCDQLFEQNGATSTPPAACAAYKVGLVPTASACTLDDDCAAETDSCDPAAHTCG